MPATPGYTGLAPPGYTGLAPPGYAAPMSATLRLVVCAALLTACNLIQGTGSDTSAHDTGATSTGSTGTTDDAVPTSGDASTAFGSDTASEPTSGGTSTDTTSEPTTGEPVDILERLLEIDGLEVEERESPVAGYRYFVMTFMQPADHADPDGLKFAQRLVLLHRDSSAPLVLATAGYFIDPDKPGLGELATLLAANQLLVEHRFFLPSRPEPADWATLTIEQAAADLHAITGAFKPVYPAKWISTGASKGGMTSVYFRRFYPEDVDGTVAYVAPQSYGSSDPRYLDFVAGLGPADCRQALADVQRELLLRRPAMITRMQAQAVDGYTYDLLGLDRALETAVVELPFTFWQYGDEVDCLAVPGPGASDDELWTFISDYNSPAYWSDYQTEMFEPYFWQAAVQLGYPALDESNVADLLLYPGGDVAASYVLPGKVPVFDAAAMPDIADWLTAEGRAMLFIYGENDPYTAAAFEIEGAQDTYRFIAPGENHGARILDLVPAERDQALAALADWSGVTPKIPRSRPPAQDRHDLRRQPR